MAGGIVLAVTSLLALTGCGSGGASTGTGTTDNSAAVAFAGCMRTHGVPNFPDPLPSGGFPRGGGPQSPAARGAQRTCIHLLKGGNGSRQAPTRAELAAALKYARCMRAHGVTDFPDPVTSLPSHNINVIEDGGVIFPLPTSIDVGAPAFQQADTACGGQRGGQPKGG